MRRPNPFNPWDCWTFEDFTAALMEEAPRVCEVHAWRDIDGDLALDPATVKVIVLLKVRPGTDRPAVKQVALRLLALGVAPGVHVEVRSMETERYEPRQQARPRWPRWLRRG